MWNREVHGRAKEGASHVCETKEATIDYFEAEGVNNIKLCVSQTNNYFGIDPLFLSKGVSIAL